MTISNQKKREIFDLIMNQNNPFKGNEENGILDFLNEIWELKSMPSEDVRFEGAENDIIQHTVRNLDWDIEYLFIDRLNLFDDDEIFIKFVNTVVNPKFRSGEEDIMGYILIINDIIEKDKLRLSIVEYKDDGMPVYEISEFSETDSFPIDIIKNKIPFIVIKDQKESDNWFGKKCEPENCPSFVLSLNNGWNDFGMKTEFHLYFYDENKKETFIGDVKIILKEGSTINKIPNNFTNLGEEFCSLGQYIKYYEQLRKLLGKSFLSVLYALNDAAFFTDIQEEFEKYYNFTNSLIRYNEPERVLREAKHLMNNIDLDGLYTFKYCFKPKYSEESIDVSFNFNDVENLPNRVYALIGKNGAGKTQLMTSLPLSISEKKDEHFEPHIPLFSKVIAVSYSIFDTFNIPKKTATFNYVYCGLRNEKGELLTERGLTLRFHNTWKKIRDMERIKQWKVVLLNFIDKELVNEFIITKSVSEFDVSIEGFQKVKKKLSSGQSIILFIISQIVSNIRYDSLILFDEPETHLHPNAITQLMNSIYSLVDEFQSYCILATHSPIVVRECFSRNVYVLERHENIPSVRKISMESFGENLTILTEDIFGNKEAKKHYMKIIQELIQNGNSYEDIVKQIESDSVPLSLNLKIYIKSLIYNQNA